MTREHTVHAFGFCRLQREGGFQCRNETRSPIGAEHLKTSISDTIRLAELTPLVHLAWVDGSVSVGERELIFQAAAHRGVLRGSPAHAQLGIWRPAAVRQLLPHLASGDPTDARARARASPDQRSTHGAQRVYGDRHCVRWRARVGQRVRRRAASHRHFDRRTGRPGTSRGLNPTRPEDGLQRHSRCGHLIKDAQRRR